MIKALLMHARAKSESCKKQMIIFEKQTGRIKALGVCSCIFCYSLVTVSVLVNITALRHHGLFVQAESQLQLQ